MVEGNGTAAVNGAGAEEAAQPVMVIAKYGFEGRNNDEVSV